LGSSKAGAGRGVREFAPSKTEGEGPASLPFDGLGMGLDIVPDRHGGQPRVAVPRDR